MRGLVVVLLVASLGCSHKKKEPPPKNEMEDVCENAKEHGYTGPCPIADDMDRP